MIYIRWQCCKATKHVSLILRSRNPSVFKCPQVIEINTHLHDLPKKSSWGRGGQSWTWLFRSPCCLMELERLKEDCEVGTAQLLCRRTEKCWFDHKLRLSVWLHWSHAPRMRANWLPGTPRPLPHYTQTHADTHTHTHRHHSHRAKGQNPTGI